MSTLAARALLSAALGSLAVSACAGAEGPRPGPAGTITAAPPSAAPAPVAPAPVAPAPVAAPAPPVESTPFRRVLVGENLQLVPLGSQSFVTLGCEQGGPFASARIEPDGIVLSDALTEGWGYCLMCACNIQGFAPDHVFRTAPREGPGDGCTTQEFRVKRGKRWRAVRGPGGGFLAVAPWSRGRKLVLGQDCGLQSALAVLDAGDQMTRAADAPNVESLTEPVQAFAAFESGEVLVLSSPSGPTPARLFIWRSGKSQPESHPLPDAVDWQTAGMVARSATDVFAGASTAKGHYLAHFDGATWKRLQVSGPTDIDALRPAKDGGVWLVGSGTRLWHVDAAGGLRSLLLPPNFTLLDVLEREPGDLWVVSDRELYRSGPVAREVTVVTDCPAAVEKEAANRQVPLARCRPRLVPPAR